MKNKVNIILFVFLSVCSYAQINFKASKSSYEDRCCPGVNYSELSGDKTIYRPLVIGSALYIDSDYNIVITDTMRAIIILIDHFLNKNLSEYEKEYKGYRKDIEPFPSIRRDAIHFRKKYIYNENK